jgi:hypothetical protein
MALDLKYEKAADMKIASPEMTWEDIAEHIKVTARQLRKVRASEDWQEYWNSVDKQTMIDHLRKAAITSQNAALYREYFSVTGMVDDTMQEALLKMSDDDFMAEAAYVAKWYTEQAAISKTANGASPPGV